MKCVGVGNWGIPRQRSKVEIYTDINKIAVRIFFPSITLISLLRAFSTTWSEICNIRNFVWLPGVFPYDSNISKLMIIKPNMFSKLQSYFDILGPLPKSINTLNPIGHIFSSIFSSWENMHSHCNLSIEEKEHRRQVDPFTEFKCLNRSFAVNLPMCTNYITLNY